MSIELVIDRDHGKGEFRAIIKMNETFTSLRKITTIPRIAYFQCKKENCDILGNTVMDPIGESLNNICAGIFLGWTHRGKIQFIIIPHSCNFPPPRAEITCNSAVTCVFFTGDLAFWAIIPVNYSSSPHF